MPWWDEMVRVQGGTLGRGEEDVVTERWQRTWRRETLLVGRYCQDGRLDESGDEKSAARVTSTCSSVHHDTCTT